MNKVTKIKDIVNGVIPLLTATSKLTKIYRINCWRLMERKIKNQVTGLRQKMVLVKFSKGFGYGMKTMTLFGFDSSIVQTL